MRLVEGKTAIVTGASRGIGRAIALRLAREGARVVLCARDGEALKRAVEEMEAAAGSTNGWAAAIALDLRRPESAARLADFAVSRFGGIAIVVNNAGATKRGEFEALTDEDWADGFALKFFGAVRLTRAAWPHLKKSAGSLIFISGVGVQVNAINPGTIRTERFEKRLRGFRSGAQNRCIRGGATLRPRRKYQPYWRARRHRCAGCVYRRPGGAFAAWVADRHGRGRDKNNLMRLEPFPGGSLSLKTRLSETGPFQYMRKS